MKNRSGVTGFLKACSNSNILAVKFLLQRYPHVIYQEDNDGNTCFIKACEYDYDLEIIKFLIDNFPFI